MSGRHKLHDATGVLIADEAGNKLFCVEDLGSGGGDAPADGSIGYAKGCIIINSGAAAVSYTHLTLPTKRIV